MKRFRWLLKVFNPFIFLRNMFSYMTDSVADPTI